MYIFSVYLCIFVCANIFGTIVLKPRFKIDAVIMIICSICSRFKTEVDPGPIIAEDPEVFTDPAPDMAPATGPDKAAVVGMTGTAPDTGPDSAGVVGSTEPAAIVSTVVLVVTSEDAGEEGGCPGPGGRHRHAHP